MSRVTIQSDAHWHELRKPRLGGTDTPCLFDVGFRSRFSLWHEKKGDLPPEDFTDNERVVLGRCLEAGIALAAQELYGLDLTKADYYLTDPQVYGLGATPDYEVRIEGATYPCEVKNASWGQWRDNWIFHDDGTVEPPLRYQLQVQTQLACADAPRGLLIALISGDRIVKCDIERHDGVIEEIRRRTVAFWESIAEDSEPEPLLPRDLEAMKRVWGAGEGSVDLSGDERIEQWLREIGELRELRRKTETEIDIIEGALLKFCVDAGYSSVRANYGRISVKQRPAKPERLVSYKAQPAKIEMRVTPKVGA